MTAYEHSVKVAWWTKSIDCGPIVEQASESSTIGERKDIYAMLTMNFNGLTAHFCDLSRYFAGEADLDTVMAHSIEWYEKPGQLTKVGGRVITS